MAPSQVNMEAGTARLQVATRSSSCDSRREAFRRAGGLRDRLPDRRRKSPGAACGVTVDHRGALIVADDLANTIWRITRHPAPAPAG